MPDDLRNISKDGEDLLSYLNKEESKDYHQEEGKGKQTYHRSYVKYKSKVGHRGKPRCWTKKEIHMYETLKEYTSLTELILMLLKTEKSISATSAQDLLKDHPMKPGSRAIAQAINRVHKKLEKIIVKNRKGVQVFYQFKRPEYKEIDLQNLLSLYRGKKAIEELGFEIPYIPGTGMKATDPQMFEMLIDKFDQLQHSLAVTQKQVHVLIEHEAQIWEAIHKLEEQQVKTIGEETFKGINFYFNSGGDK